MRGPVRACLAIVLLVPALAVAESESQYVDAGREALRAQWKLPWYDPATDSLSRSDIPPLAADAGRHTKWRYSSRPPRSSQRVSWRLSWMGAILESAAWILLGVLLLGVIAALIWSFLRIEGKTSGASDVLDEEIPESDRLDQLPVPVERSNQNLLETARMYQKAGDYAQAIIYLFAHMLVQLDRRHLIRLTRGKTNRQYLRELEAQLARIEATRRGADHHAAHAGAERPPIPDAGLAAGIGALKGSRVPLATVVQHTMIAFEDVFFGHHPISHQRFQHCWAGLATFTNQLEELA